MDKVAATKAVNKLEKPAGMYRPSWLKLKKILRALCHYLPDPYPGIRRLAHDTKMPARTVADLLTKAEAHGLIARATRTIPGKRDGYTYRLTCLDAVQVSVQVSAQTCTEEEDLRSSLFTTFREKNRRGRFGSPAARPRKPNQYTGRCHVCAEIVWPREGVLHGPLPVHRECDPVVRREDPGNPDGWGDAIGADPEAPLPSASTRPAKPQARLAKYFEGRWNDDALGWYPNWRGQYRGIELGAAIGYIRRTFLDAGYSDEHVEAMIDAFFDDLLSPYCGLEVKEGQSAWQLFTGWWGHNPVPDPRIAREAQERHDAMVAQARKQGAVRKVAEDAAWVRIDAAIAAGEHPDPDDLRTVGMPYRLKLPTSR